MQGQERFQVYNASAGSGKTYTLVKEYLKILLSTEDNFRFQHILAITFTNKAAAEMKERVLENLKDFSENESHDMMQQIADEIKLPIAVLHVRSKSILQCILQNYGGFNITTIDSFTHKIIRSFAFDLGLSLNFEVEMDSVSLLDEAVDVLISKIGEDKHLTEVLINYSLDKTDDDKSWDISNDLKEFSRVLLNEDHALQLRQLESKSVEDYTRLKISLKKNQVRLKEEGKEIGEKGLSIIDDMGLNHNDFYYSMIPKHFLSLIAGIGDAKFFDQTKLKERIEERNFYSKSKSDDIKGAIESIVPPLLELYTKSEMLYQKYVLNDLVLKSLIPMAVLKQINSTLTEIKELNNIRLNAEFNQLISNQIKNEPAPFIYERIGEKFRYYFIDEMQDTSELQWQNLIPLIENSLTSETIDGQCGSLMLVGDAKQAIYRWRGGKAEQFIRLTQKNENVVFSVEKEVKNLEQNYRSYSEIVNFNNAFFTHVSSFFKNDFYKQLYAEGSHQKTTEKKGGYVQVSLVDTDIIEEKELVYPKRVLRIIQNLEEGVDLSDICVLVRTKKQGIAISSYLSEHKIPIVSSETLLLKNNDVVKFIINILSFISEETNKEVLADALCFLKNNLPICKDTHEFLSERMLLDAQNVFDSLFDFGIEFKMNEFNGLPFYDATEYLIRSFNLEKRGTIFMQSFLDIVLEYERKKGLGLVGFLEYWNRKKNNLSVVIPDGQKAVQIMTIHKSKGLEFPIVIFPYDLNIYKEIKPKIWFNSLDPDNFEGFESSLVDYSKKISYTGNYGAQIHQERQNELELDNLNLLYVALTRAEVQLYVITAIQKKEKELNSSKTYSDLFADFLKVHSDKISPKDERVFDFGCKEESSQKSKVGQPRIVVEQRDFISSTWKNQNISIVTRASKLWNTEQETSILYGNLIHEILSKIKRRSDIDGIVEFYEKEGLLNEYSKSKVKEVIFSIVNHPLLEKYFTIEYEIKNEQEIVSETGVIQIPDRLCFMNGKVTVIDYKTGVSLAKHKNQLNNYALTLSSLGFEVAEKLLVYIGSGIKLDRVV